MFGWFKRSKRRVASQTWRGARVLRGLDERELDEIEKLAETQTLTKGEVLVEEGDQSTDLFIVVRGSLEIRSHDGRRDRHHRLAAVGPGDVIGEAALFEELPRSATVAALSDAEVVRLPLPALRERVAADRHLQAAFQRLVLNIAEELATRLRHHTNAAVETAREREAMGHFVVNVLILMCAYLFFLSGLERFWGGGPANTSYVSIPLQIVFGAASWWFIRNSGYPRSEFGLSLRHLVGSLIEAVVFTVPVLGLLTGVKSLVIWITGATDPLIAHPDVVARLNEPDVVPLLVVYALSSAVQELIVRGALQSSLMRFLVGPRRVQHAIVVSALLFSVTHLHMSFLFATLAFLPGLFWGWLYARRKNLAGVTLSHVAVGAYVFFIMGVRL